MWQRETPVVTTLQVESILALLEKSISAVHNNDASLAATRQPDPPAASRSGSPSGSDAPVATATSNSGSETQEPNAPSPSGESPVQTTDAAATGPHDRRESSAAGASSAKGASAQASPDDAESSRHHGTFLPHVITERVRETLREMMAGAPLKLSAMSELLTAMNAVAAGEDLDGQSRAREEPDRDQLDRLRSGAETDQVRVFNILYVLSIVSLQRETEEKARQPETKLGAIAQTRHTARLCNAKRNRTRHPKPTHGARDRPEHYICWAYTLRFKVNCLLHGKAGRRIAQEVRRVSRCAALLSPDQFCTSSGR
jgi:hypothetical protein